MSLIRLIENIITESDLKRYALKDEELVMSLKLSGYDVSKVTEDKFINHGVMFDVYNVDNKYVLKKSKKDAKEDEVLYTVTLFKRLIGKRFKNVAKLLFCQYYRTKGIAIIVQEFIPKTHNLDDWMETQNKYTDTVVGSICDYYINNGKKPDIDYLFDIGAFGDEFENSEQVERVYSDGRIDKLMDDLCNGIDELRTVGIVPRDIHEGNIRIDKKGNYVIVDF